MNPENSALRDAIAEALEGVWREGRDADDLAAVVVAAVAPFIADAEKRGRDAALADLIPAHAWMEKVAEAERRGAEQAKDEITAWIAGHRIHPHSALVEFSLGAYVEFIDRDPATFEEADDGAT